ncbi:MULTISPECIES: hypothetical protein [unclassified Mesorhizobium]|uniref:hypothetical protein n=1 Tax=unclassified Mesorhizobium TaxID=325217 RepID=UPI0033359180
MLPFSRKIPKPGSGDAHRLFRDTGRAVRGHVCGHPLDITTELRSKPGRDGEGWPRRDKLRRPVRRASSMRPACSWIIMMYWHGATPTTAMSHIAIQESLDCKAVERMEKVSDEQYRR